MFAEEEFGEQRLYTDRFGVVSQENDKWQARPFDPTFLSVTIALQGSPGIMKGEPGFAGAKLARNGDMLFSGVGKPTINIAI